MIDSKKIVEIEFNQTIIKMIVSDFSNQCLIITLSENNIEKKYYLLNLKTCEYKEINLPIINYDLLNPVCFIGEEIVFNFFKNKTNPETTGLVLYNTQKDYWNLTYLNAKILKINSDELFYSLNDITYSLKSEKNSNLTNLHSLVYKDDDEGFILLKRFIFNKFNLIAVNTIEYFENISFFIISYYIYKSEISLENKLAIFDLKGILLFEECIDNESFGVTNNSFIPLNNGVIYIKNRHLINFLQFTN